MLVSTDSKYRTVNTTVIIVVVLVSLSAVGTTTDVILSSYFKIFPRVLCPEIRESNIEKRKNEIWTYVALFCKCVDVRSFHDTSDMIQRPVRGDIN